MNLGVKWSLVGLVPLACVFIVGVGAQFGLLRGSPNAELGVVNGRLAPPSLTPNSVSSQADLYPDHSQRAYARVEPFRPRPGESMSAAWQRLAQLVRHTSGLIVMSESDDYLRAEASTRWLKFTDDVELLRADAEGVIHVRSASRLGRKDFGVNRQRVDAWQHAFNADMPAR